MAIGRTNFGLPLTRKLRQIVAMQSTFTGPVYVVGDNIDTDQIIPAQFLNLIPTIPDEYEKLGAYALWGLPDSLYTTRFVKEGALTRSIPLSSLAGTSAAVVRASMRRLRWVRRTAR